MSVQIHKRFTGMTLRVMAVFTLLASGISLAAVEDDIRARLQPAGQLCMVGDDCAAGLAVAGAADTGPKDPAQVYQTFCFACHQTGANNAPVLANAEQWGPRIDKGIDVLYANAINGFNNGAMPARGLCTDCSDEDVQATVDYMVSQLP